MTTVANSNASKVPASSLSSLPLSSSTLDKDKKELDSGSLKQLLVEMSAQVAAQVSAQVNAQLDTRFERFGASVDAKITKTVAEAVLPQTSAASSSTSVASASSASLDATSSASAGKAKTATVVPAEKLAKLKTKTSAAASASSASQDASSAATAAKAKTAAASATASTGSFASAFNAFAQRQTASAQPSSGQSLFSILDDEDEDAEDPVAAESATSVQQATRAAAAAVDVMDDKHVLRSIDKITRNGRYDAADWARACSYLNARNKHEVIRWAGLIDLILSDASKEAVLAHAGRCMMGVKLADEHNNYALTGVLTGHHTESDVTTPS